MTKKLFKFENLKPLIVLTAICLVVAALLAGINMIAAPIIEKAANDKAYAALKVVLPDGSNFEEISLTDNYPGAITKAYKADGGYVFEANVTGNHSGLVIMCGLDADGKIVGVKTIAQEETPSFWSKVLSLVDGTNTTYAGKSSEDIEAQIVTGATNSSNGIYKAVTAALDAYTVANGGEIAGEPELPTPEDEVIIMAEVLLGAEFKSLTDVTPEGTTNVMRVYKDASGKNYAVYTVVISQYGTPETEAIVHVTNTGVIEKVRKITWKVSDANPEWGYNPPSDERVDQLFKDFEDKTLDNIDEVELSTGATNTGTNLVNALKEAITVVKDLAIKDMPTSEEDVVKFAEELLSVEAGSLIKVDAEETENIRRIYKDKTGKNYAVYTVVISQYGTPETETVVHISNTGVIKGIKKITWKVSDAKPEWGYNPPSEDRVNQLFGDLIDKNSETLDDVDIVTGATNTGKNLISSMKEAISIVKEFAKLDMPTAEEEIIAFAKELLGVEENELVNVTPEDSEYIKRVYRTKDGKNYAVYTVVISQYGTPETETLIHISNTGVIKGVKKITWRVSDAKPEWGYNPPSEDRVNQLFGDLVDKNSETIDNVEIQTGATNTGKNLIAAAKEAISTVKALAILDMPTAEETVISLAEELLGTGAGTLTNVTRGNSDYIRRVYRTQDGKNYVVYAVVISQYGTPETETLIHIDENGTVKGIKKITWKVSDAKPEWGYNPPSDDRVEQLYGDLLNKNADNIDEVDIETGATNTGKNLVLAVKDAFDIVKDIIEAEKEPIEESQLPRIVGILILAFGIGAVLTFIVTKAIIRRKR